MAREVSFVGGTFHGFLILAGQHLQVLLPGEGGSASIFGVIWVASPKEPPPRSWRHRTSVVGNRLTRC